MIFTGSGFFGQEGSAGVAIEGSHPASGCSQRSEHLHSRHQRGGRGDSVIELIFFRH